MFASAFERSRCRGGRFAWFDRAIAMSQNKIGVSRKMSIEYPYKQLPCQTQGGFLQTALSAVTRRSRSCSSPVLLRRVTPDRVLAFVGSNPLALIHFNGLGVIQRDGAPLRLATTPQTAIGV